MKKSIIWLASYPKSGNTWTRVFLANYLANLDRPLSINEVHRFGMGDSVVKTYNAVAGREINVQDAAVALQLRNRVLGGIVANNADVNFVKTHNINGVAMGHTMIPEEVTKSAIYIMRNPLDTAVSYARHFGMAIDDAVDALNRSDTANAPDANTVWQYLGSWSDHVKSWTQQDRFPVCILRYEDLLEDPHQHFGNALKLIGLPVEPERLDRAIEFSSFNELSRQESAGGFVEKSPNTERFFAKGRSEQWRDELTPEMVSSLRRSHKRLMKKYGYYRV